MPSSIRGVFSRRARLAAAAVTALAATTLTGPAARAQEERVGSAYSLSFGTDASSHFISYGADVWAGGDEFSPFSARSTVFTYGTLTAKFADNLSGFVNVWGDLNDNVDSGIGGPIQEVDVNVGLTLTLDKFSITGAHGSWHYAGEVEKIADLVVAYNDGGSLIPNVGLNPNVTFHYRYDGNNGQEPGLAVVPGIKPSFTFGADTKYPVTLGIPVAVAFFQDGFQGGDSGLGFVSAGAVVSVPLAFVPPKFGLWTASASATYYHTPEDTIPNNPEENFVVTALSLGLSF